MNFGRYKKQLMLTSLAIILVIGFLFFYLDLLNRLMLLEYTIVLYLNALRDWMHHLIKPI